MADNQYQSQPSPGQSIPIPTGFPVSWDDPVDARRLWRLDPIHYPNPLPVLEHDLHQGYDAAGMSRGLESYNLPLRSLQRNINGYLYSSIISADAQPEFLPRLMYHVKRFAPGLVRRMEDQAVAGMSKKYLEPVNARLENLRTFWEGELLPEVQMLLGRWRAFDLDGAGWEALLAHLEWTLEANEQAGYLHSLIAVPIFLGLSEFDELYNELFPHAGPFDNHQLLLGFDNQFSRGDRWLWNLGRKALTMPAVQEILEREAAAGILLALNKSATGQVFVEEFNRFVAQHGHRNAFISYSARGWQEDPSPLIKLLKDYISLPDRDKFAELEAEGVERERRVAQAQPRSGN